MLLQMTSPAPQMHRKRCPVYETNSNPRNVNDGHEYMVIVVHAGAAIQPRTVTFKFLRVEVPVKFLNSDSGYVQREQTKCHEDSMEVLTQTRALCDATR